MSDARKILDERLAKGEIDETEYDKLVAKLGSNSGSAPQPTAPLSVQTRQPTTEASISKDGAVLWMAIPAGIFGVMMLTAPDDLVGLSSKGIMFVVALAGAFLFGLVKYLAGK